MGNRQSGHVHMESPPSRSSATGSSSLKDGRKVVIRAYSPRDKEGLVSMYADLSEETLRWAFLLTTARRSIDGPLTLRIE